MITGKKYKIPFEFILDYLSPKEVLIKPMFGCFGLYLNDKMYFFLRDRKDKKELNGVWIALATPASYESLAAELPSINQDLVLDEKSNNRWLLLSDMDNDFESLVIRTCELVLKNDARIGKITMGSL